MKLPKNVSYRQLKNISIEEIRKALLRDGCIEEEWIFEHPTKNYRIKLHFHPHKTFSANFIRDYILPITKWDIKDLKRLKLILLVYRLIKITGK